MYWKLKCLLISAFNATCVWMVRVQFACSSLLDYLESSVCGFCTPKILHAWRNTIAHLFMQIKNTLAAIASSKIVNIASDRQMEIGAALMENKHFWFFVGTQMSAILFRPNVSPFVAMDCPAFLIDANTMQCNESPPAPEIYAPKIKSIDFHSYKHTRGTETNCMYLLHRNSHALNVSKENVMYSTRFRVWGYFRSLNSFRTSDVGFLSEHND